MNRSLRILVPILIVAWFGCGTLWADSALPLLSGFDAQRIEAIRAEAGSDSTSELAKLVFRLRNIDPQFLADKVPEDIPGGASQLGDAVRIEGEVDSVKKLAVPEKLHEFLDLTALQVIELITAEGNLRLITTGVTVDCKPGDRLTGVGVALAFPTDDKASNQLRTPWLVALPRVSWYPAAPSNPGWKLLSDQGVDISLLAGVATRNRQPLSGDDGDAFYSILAAANQIGGQAVETAAVPVEPVTLLRDSKDHVGDWVSMTLETVQVTRVAVTDSERQTQLGGDHYFQIDAVGDLGNTVVKIARPDGEEGPPVLFENRYPVSLVMKELPDFLRQGIRDQEGGDAMVAEIRLPIETDAIFFRLWSYSSDYMDRRGGGEQFGPLLMAAELRARNVDPAVAAGIGWIPWIAAMAILGAIVVISVWNHLTARSDQQVKQRRKASEAEQLQLPDESAF